LSLESCASFHGTYAVLARQEKTTRDTLPHDLDSRKLFDFVFCRAGHIFFSAKEFILSF
jgi:hypothetical protein